MSAAPWPLIDDIKTALKLSTTDLSFDGEIAAWIAAAESFIQYHTNVPVASTPFTDVDRTVDDQPTATFAPTTTLMVNRYPVDPAQPITVAAYDGTTVDTILASATGGVSQNDMFYMDYLKGVIYAVEPSDITFGQGPYTITYNAGLACHPQWSTKYRAIAGQVVRDFCAWLSDNRNPGVASEGAGAGVMARWRDDCVPPRLRMFVRMLPGAGVPGVGIGV